MEEGDQSFKTSTKKKVSLVQKRAARAKTVEFGVGSSKASEAQGLPNMENSILLNSVPAEAVGKDVIYSSSDNDKSSAKSRRSKFKKGRTTTINFGDIGKPSYSRTKSALGQEETSDSPPKDSVVTVEKLDSSEGTSSKFVHARTEEWISKVSELATRGIALRELLEFYSCLLDQNGPMPHFDPKSSLTVDVVRGAIIPLTADSQLYEEARALNSIQSVAARLSLSRVSRNPLLASGQTKLKNCALATMVHQGEERLPQAMVTHHWQNIFSHTVAAVLSDAFEKPTYSAIASKLRCKAGIRYLQRELHNIGKLDKVYWMCLASVNQHCAICAGFLSGNVECDTVSGEPFKLCSCDTAKHFHGDLCEMNKFNEIMEYLAGHVDNFSQVIAVDVEFEIFNRAWCLAELVVAQKQGMPQSVKVHSSKQVQRNRHMLSLIDVCKCQASREEDKELILASIPDTDEFNRFLIDLLMGSSQGIFNKCVADMEKVAEEYLLNWDMFSDELTEKLTTTSSVNPLLFVGLFLAIFLPIDVLASLPLAGIDRGWTSQSFFFLFMLPVGAVYAGTPIATWYYVSMKSDMSAFKLVCWHVMFGVSCSLPIFVIASASDAFPVPNTTLCMGVPAILVTSSLVFLESSAIRQRPGYMSDLFLFACMIVGNTAVSGGLVVLNGFISTVDAGWQSLLIVGYLLLKLFLERVGSKVPRRMGSDLMPLVIFQYAFVYETALCLALLEGFHPAPFCLLLFIDTAENAYHIWSLARLLASEAAAQDSTRTEGNEENTKKHVFIISSVMLREMVEVMVPAGTLQMLMLLFLLPTEITRFIIPLCNASDQEKRKVVLFLGLELIVELCVGISTCIYLQRLGFAPVGILRGLVAANFIPFATAGLCFSCIFMSVNHAHFGNDLAFEFPWLRDGAQWLGCGFEFALS